jgi:hypothetical protein
MPTVKDRALADVGLVERQRFADPEPCPPKDRDQRSQTQDVTVMAGDRRRPAASITTVEPEDMTNSLLRIGVSADPRRPRPPRPLLDRSGR